MNYDDDFDEDEDFAALFVMGELYDEEVRRNRGTGGGCLTTALMILMIPIIIILACLGG